MQEESADEKSKNLDPVTGEPGSHPVGSGVGAASGGVTGAALGGAVGGPAGAAIGAVVGGIVGAYSGRGVAETLNPTLEEAYWRENHAAQPWAEKSLNFEHYALAYRTGFEGAQKYAGKQYQEIEADLARDYEKNDANPAMPWDRARPAVKAAWDRLGGVQAPRDTDRGLRGGL